MDVQALCFVAEWYDNHADLVRQYYFNYFTDGTIELVDKKTNKAFLKRIDYGNIAEKDLFLGSVLTM